MPLRWANTILWTVYFALLVYAQGGSLPRRTAAAATAPTPISFPPAQNWDGPDGPWSSFTLRVGTPAQDVRVLISSASQATWVVLPDGCKVNDTGCQGDRGEVYNYNHSSTWSQNGLYELYNERNLGMTGNGFWGNDTIGLGIQGSGGPTLPNQVLAGIVTNNFYLGMFGVNPKPTNYTGIETDQQDSYMTTLKKRNMIPSVSFGYTAGAQYRLKKVLGSLTLGGYDQSRFTTNPLSISFAPDNDRDLVVGVQSIKATNGNGTTHSLLPEGILAYVDSTIPYIWLPLDACREFEKAFGLTWDDKRDLYLVDDALHEKLLAQNASVSFTIGNGPSAGQTVDITLPYASFDLMADFPLVANRTNYFPLKRAVNETQYTLGRTFLQEAYLIVDYERSNFSISQCVFQQGLQQNLVSIPSANTTTTGSTRKSTASSSHNTIIAIVVAVVVFLLSIVGAIVLFFGLRNRTRKRKEAEEKAVAAKEAEEKAERIRLGFDKAEVGAGEDHALYEMAGSAITDLRVEAEGHVYPDFVKEEKAALADMAGMHELTGSRGNIAELGDQKRLVHEMYDPSVTPVELPADVPRELPGSIPSPRSTRGSRSTPSFYSARQTPPERSTPTSPISSQSAGRRSSRRSGPTSPVSSPSAGQSSPHYSNPTSPLGRPHPLASPVDRRIGRTPQSRSSTLNSLPFAPSPHSGPSSPTDRSAPSSPQSGGVFSPISPVGESSSEERSPVDQRPLVAMLQGLSHPTPSPGGSPRRSQHETWYDGTSHITSQRADKERRRRRNEF